MRPQAGKLLIDSQSDIKLVAFSKAWATTDGMMRPVW